MELESCNQKPNDELQWFACDTEWQAYLDYGDSLEDYLEIKNSGMKNMEVESLYAMKEMLEMLRFVKKKCCNGANIETISAGK